MPARPSVHRLYRHSLAAAARIGKAAAVFFIDFPQFISAPSYDSHWSANQQYLLLASTFAQVFALGVASTAVFSHRLRAVLQRPKRLLAVNRLMGRLLVGMGAWMAAVR